MDAHQKNFPIDDIENPVIASRSQAITELNKFVPSHDEIARTAYYLYQGRGFEENHQLDHWLKAESRLIAEREFRPISPEGVTKK